MTLLQRYFRSQAFWPLVISLSALATLALLTQSLSTIDLIVENRQSAFIFLKVTVLALPQLVSIIMPLAMFLAMMFALNRLNVDSELVVAKASGMSPTQIASPAMRLAVLSMIAHLLLNLWVQPTSFRSMRATLLDVRSDIAAQMLRPGEFIQPATGVTVYAREIKASGDMVDVLIYDARSAIEPLTHTAKSGQMSNFNGRTLLALKTGNIQALTPTGTLDIIQFETHIIDLTDIMAMDPVLRLKTSDKYLHELFSPTDRERSNKKGFRKLIAEGHARLSAPIYNITLTLLALAFLVRGEYQRLGYGKRITLCAITGFIIRLSGFALTAAAEGNAALNPLQYALPIGVSLICAAYLLSRRRWTRAPIKRRRKKAARQALAQELSAQRGRTAA